MRRPQLTIYDMLTDLGMFTLEHSKNGKITHEHTCSWKYVYNNFDCEDGYHFWIEHRVGVSHIYTRWQIVKDTTDSKYPYETEFDTGMAITTSLEEFSDHDLIAFGLLETLCDVRRENNG